MNKQTVMKLIGNIRSGVVKKSPEILTGIGIAGMITTTVLAVKATPKAVRIIEEAEQEKEDFLTKKEVVKLTWKLYIPTAVTCVMSTACLIGSTSVNSRRAAAFATAYKLSETALSEYKEKVIETVGEETERVVREKIADEKLESNPVSQNNLVVTGKGAETFYDTLSGRYFQSNVNELERIKNELNSRIFHEMYISLNEFYDEIGLPHISVGDDLGWNTDGMIDLELNGRLNEDGTLCIVVDYRVAPRYEYDRIS